MAKNEIITFLIACLSVLQSCGQEVSDRSVGVQADTALSTIQKSALLHQTINVKGKTLEQRFVPPKGYTRIEADSNSFAAHLRSLPLKPHQSPVKYYNGQHKPSRGVYDAVVDLDIGNKNLHQCADAVMRLRAGHLYKQKQYSQIHFNFTNGFRCDYSEWMKGKRIVVNGNKVYWKQKAKPSNTYTVFWKYMETVFMYAGTLSLSKELKPVSIENMHIGDVFIQGGSPGHAVIVVDMAVDQKTDKKVFLLAQSYMPAQEIQILKNPANTHLSPWYPLDFGEVLNTPEWRFYKDDLKRF